MVVGSNMLLSLASVVPKAPAMSAREKLLFKALCISAAVTVLGSNP